MHGKFSFAGMSVLHKPVQLHGGRHHMNLISSGIAACALSFGSLVRVCPQVDQETLWQKYKLARDKAHVLQEQAAKRAGMTANFCSRMGWGTMEVLMSRLQACPRPQQLVKFTWDCPVKTLWQTQCAPEVPQIIPYQGLLPGMQPGDTWVSGHVRRSPWWVY